MAIMKVFVTIIFILISVALTAIILMQEGKDAGLGTIGGIGETYWAKNKSRSVEGNMVRFTKLLAAIFLVLAILLNMMPDKNTTAATTTAQTEAAVSSTESETAAVASTEAEAGTEKSGTEAETAVQKETLLANTEQGTEAK
ncbi:MAG TPA: preprotein translocase subunit SecG [Lachnospiraceae bacterium]|nr:preprotein translocase subunit SecG [Lachnospiraceae bacterium]HCG59470.1 preprotein translocase subunit SecG [Lachnospiraceae bacterium]